jgi:hypothetical protein
MSIQSFSSSSGVRRDWSALLKRATKVEIPGEFAFQHTYIPVCYWVPGEGENRDYQASNLPTDAELRQLGFNRIGMRVGWTVWTKSKGAKRGSSTTSGAASSRRSFGGLSRASS